PSLYRALRSLISIRPSLFACFILTLAGTAKATTAMMPSDDNMVISSRAIIRAKVISQVCGFDSRQTIVYTYVTVRVREVLKGEISSREIVLKEPGGQVGDRGTVFFGSPRFTNGENVVLYLDTWPDGSLRVHDLFVGKFTVVTDRHTGQRIAVREMPDSAVAIIPMTPARGQAQAPESTSRMELLAYLRMVRKRTAALAEQSRQFEQQYYSGVRMLAEPPDFQDLAGAGRLEPQFHLFSPPARWFEPDDGQPVTYLINLDQAPSGSDQVVNDINAAMRAWSTVQGSSLQVVNGGTTTACEVPDRGVVDFNNCEGFFSPSACLIENIFLAEGGINYGASTKVVNGTGFYQIFSSFLSINPYAACWFAAHCNLQEI